MVDLLVELSEKKEVIASFLKSFFAQKRTSWSKLNRWGPDTIDRLEAFTLNGKMLRGALVLWTASFFGKSEEDALEVAAAVELLQSSLLIHDDIMDEDVLRRNLPSIHKQFEQVGVKEDISRPDHFGVSMALCAGDISLFLAYELLSFAKVEYPEKLASLFSELVAVVGLGQMQDVYFGHASDIPVEEDILAMYEHKTATYTFCLPLLLGAAVGGAKEDQLPLFNDLGVLMGKIFQLKDDELGLFSSDSALGKTVGIDIMLGKKTVFYALLLKAISVDERTKLTEMQSASSTDALPFIQSLLQKYSLQSLVTTKMEELATASRSIISTLPISKEGKQFLLELLNFNLQRTK